MRIKQALSGCNGILSDDVTVGKSKVTNPHHLRRALSGKMVVRPIFSENRGKNGGFGVYGSGVRRIGILTHFL